MLSLVETSKQRAPRVATDSVAEALRPVTPLENWQRRRSITGPLATSIIHDLRNPLAAICASAEMLTDPHLTRDRADRLKRSLHKSAGQMRGLVEAMPRGGQIRISARKAGCFAFIAVEDSGPGIPPEICGRLFAPFVTLGKKEGLGLGLALSRRTVRDHGGDMWIEPASGARFVIRLPLSKAFPRVGQTTAKNIPTFASSAASGPSSHNSKGVSENRAGQGISRPDSSLECR